MVRHVGNEYVQLVELRLPDSSRLFVGNVYLPPANNLGSRGISERDARELVADVLNGLVPGAPTMVCGDWNTRIGDRSPEVGADTLQRRSQDTRVCPRAGWLLSLLATHELYVLNGLQPGAEAPFTCATATGSSVVDLLASRDPSHRVTAYPTTLEGLSDHTV